MDSESQVKIKPTEYKHKIGGQTKHNAAVPDNLDYIFPNRRRSVRIEGICSFALNI